MVKQKYDRVYNFSAGPSILPLEVLQMALVNEPRGIMCYGSIYGY